jgi:hypothetical protein
MRTGAFFSRFYGFSAGTTVLFCALLVAGCAVTRGTHVDFTGPAPGCASALGSYALPKAFLHVRVQRIPDTTAKPSKPASSVIGVEVVRHADTSLNFCLEHVSSVFADDDIKVVRDTHAVTNFSEPVAVGALSDVGLTPFLNVVSVHATDRSVQIIVALLRSAFALISGDSGFLNGRALFGALGGAVADLEFDPFDRSETARANLALSNLGTGYGYCVFIPRYSFSERLSPERYCDHPEEYNVVNDAFPTLYQSYSATSVDPGSSGILYRPLQSFPVAVYAKSARGQWVLQTLQNQDLENIAPVMSLHIERAPFTGRQAYFLFKQGALLGACVSKGSEIEGAVQIPLEVSRALVALPASIIQVKIGSTNKESDLAKAQLAVLSTQQAAINALLQGTSYASPAGLKPGGQTPAIQPKIDDILKNLPTGDWSDAPGFVDDNSFFSTSINKICGGT